jgi:lipopolysaccharide export system permease protein
MFILDRYILKSHIPPYLFSLIIITFIFIMDFIIRYLDMFIDKGVDFFVVLEFFVLSLGHMFALIIPMSVMPATLMAFGQFASENEITAMKATGISLYRMITPVVGASLILGAGLIYYQNDILPESNHRLMSLMLDIGKMKPTLEIKENIFSTAVDGYTILVREKDDKTGRIEDIQIFRSKKGTIPVTIIAERGKMSFIESENVLRFELEDGEIHEMPDASDISTYRKTLFSNFTINMKDTERGLERSQRSYRSDREMSSGMMRARIAELDGEIAGYSRDMNISAKKEIIGVLSTVMAFDALEGEDRGRQQVPMSRAEKRAQKSARNPAEQQMYALETILRRITGLESQISRYEVEIHKKYSIPFSCIIFVLLGAPLAIRSGKRGMTMSIAFSILFFLIYYVFLITGEKLADRRLLDPWLAMWLPNIILFSAAALLLWSTVREAQTINWERFNMLKRWRQRGIAGIL